MKSSKTICTLLVMAMCSCTNGAAPEKQQEVSTQSEVQTIEPVHPADYQTLTREPGTVFYDITLEQALEKAKRDGKYVLIDCHTKNCGPCKKMENEVFPREDIGNFINERFVPSMVDIEEGEGPEIAEKYNVQIYPTYLALLPNGVKEGEIVGAEFNIDIFVDMIKTIIHE